MSKNKLKNLCTRYRVHVLFQYSELTLTSYNVCIYSAMNIFIIADCFVMSMLLSASVFSVSLDPVNNSMAVTGGEDDKAYVWRIQDGETHMECLGRF